MLGHSSGPVHLSIANAHVALSGQSLSHDT